jgi:hypothetical protein
MPVKHTSPFKQLVPYLQGYKERTVPVFSSFTGGTGTRQQPATYQEASENSKQIIFKAKVAKRNKNNTNKK